MELVVWIGFFAFVGVMLFIDLGVLNRKAHAIKTKEALGWTAMWVTVALLFNVLIYFLYQNHVGGLGMPAKEGEAALTGLKAARQFFTGYIVELSLSLDNMFVIAMIMSHFRVPAQYQHRVLFWGILGAVILRGLMIGLGAALVKQFDWMFYVFGAILLFSAFKMLALKGDDDLDVESSWIIRGARKLYPISSEYDGQKFFTMMPVEEKASRKAESLEPSAGGRGGGVVEVSTIGADRQTRMRRAFTPLAIVLLMVESADVVFAVDSIPAIFGITQDPFLVLTSNVFAILGLRSLYFALAGMMDRFHYLKLSLVFVLAFIGIKMILHKWTHEWPDWVSLAVIASLLGVGIAASLLIKPKHEHEPMLGRDVERVARLTIKQARKLIILVMGLTIVVGGILVMTLPGPSPGPLIVPLGLGLLATEFLWAKWLLRKYKQGAEELFRQSKRVLAMRKFRHLFVLSGALIVAGATYLTVTEFREGRTPYFAAAIFPGIALVVVGFMQIARVNRAREQEEKLTSRAGRSPASAEVESRWTKSREGAGATKD